MYADNDQKHEHLNKRARMKLHFTEAEQNDRQRTNSSGKYMRMAPLLFGASIGGRLVPAMRMCKRHRLFACFKPFEEIRLSAARQVKVYPYVGTDIHKYVYKHKQLYTARLNCATAFGGSRRLNVCVCMHTHT